MQSRYNKHRRYYLEWVGKYKVTVIPAVYVNAVADIFRRIDAGMEKHWMKMNDSAHVLYTLGSRSEGGEIETYKPRRREIQATICAIMAYVTRDINNLSSHGRSRHPQPTHDHAAGYAGSFIGSIAGSQGNLSRASGISKNAMPLPATHEEEVKQGTGTNQLQFLQFLIRRWIPGRRPRRLRRRIICQQIHSYNSTRTETQRPRPLRNNE